MNKRLKTIGFIFLGFVSLCVGAFVLLLLYIGMVSPETYIYRGENIPPRFMKKIQGHGLLEKQETIQYFYSDGLWDMDEGFYFVTDNNLVLYSNEWDPKQNIIPFEQITYVSAVYNDGFFVDSIVTVDTDVFEYSFPLSSEKGRDHKFVEFLEVKTIKK